jgi:hypothetical protein
MDKSGRLLLVHNHLTATQPSLLAHTSMRLLPDRKYESAEPKVFAIPLVVAQGNLTSKKFVPIDHNLPKTESCQTKAYAQPEACYMTKKTHLRLLIANL